MKLTLILLLLGIIAFNFANAWSKKSRHSFMQDISDGVNQLIVVTPLKGVAVRIALYERINIKHPWMQPKFIFSFNGVMGESGIAKPGTKVEGDGKTPQGLFALGSAFGYNKMALNMDYHLITKEDKFIDDPDSLQYNTWVVGKTDAKRYENMLLKTNAYSMGVIINYNINPVIPGKGSAIFIHVWNKKCTGTGGCIAISSFNMKKLLSWLDKCKNPHILIQPQTTT